jgi:tRNA/tmRNA/rRNA uracil-C5-methylase (TrmA/RlmC/RlmD family)
MSEPAPEPPVENEPGSRTETTTAAPRARRVREEHEKIGPVEVGPVAHGGHCVARHEGRVIFVRHALPGERVMVRVTDDRHDRFWRADAVEILSPSPDRVEPPCPIARPGLCGGCDFQHAALPAQRRLKTAVVAEQLRRLAGIEWTGEVAEASTPDTVDGLHWRTRMRYVTDEAGRVGLRAHREHRVVPLPPGGCRIAAPGALTGDEGIVAEVAAGRRWAVDAAGFWQVHPAAADTLVGAMIDGLRPEPGERALDLYAGVGLFAGALGDAGCKVWAVEGSRAAAALAEQNLADVAERVTVRAGRVERVLRALPHRVDLVVLDPPRTGAGRAVIAAVLARRPRAVAYVACDPAALARDLATAAELGYDPDRITAYDLFPMTHHVECLAVLTPRSGSPRPGR